MQDKLVFLHEYLDDTLKNPKLLQDKSTLKAILVTIFGDFLRETKEKLQDTMS